MTDGPDWKDEYPDDAPESAADPRPGGEPYYIDSECPDCGTELVYYDDVSVKHSEDVHSEVFPDTAFFYDEFVCPECLDGIHMDWPQTKCSSCGEETAVQLVDHEGRCGSCIPEEEIEPLETVSKEEMMEALDDE